MACSRYILAHNKEYLAAFYDKHTTTFQMVITKIQTFSILVYDMYVVVVLSKLLVVYMFKY